MTKQVRILIVDDHTLMRSGIRALLERADDLRVVGEAGDGHEALRLIRELDPHVVLMDISIPGLNGLEVAAKVRKEHPGVKIVFLSMHSSEEYIVRALNVGAAGYVLKDATTNELELAVRSATKGETFLSPAVSTKVVGNYVARFLKNDAPPGLPGSFHVLTPRQREILQLIAEGNTTKDIAKKLGLSVNTVEVHRANLMDRLGIHDVAGLVRYAISEGMIQSIP
jgi:DNA-binding NarL/FixJ family response regulator